MWFMLGVRDELITMYHKKHIYKFPYVEGDIQWNERNTMRFPALCAFAGLVAGMFGIGGGIVKGPLMLEMGIHPQVSSATAATMIFFTTSTASVQFVIFGLMQIDYATFLFVLGLVATYAGQVIVN